MDTIPIIFIFYYNNISKVGQNGISCFVDYLMLKIFSAKFFNAMLLMQETCREQDSNSLSITPQNGAVVSASRGDPCV